MTGKFLGMVPFRCFWSEPLFLVVPDSPRPLSCREYLTGFHKRKVERKKAAIEEIKQRLKKEQKKLREEVQRGGRESLSP